MIAWTIYITFAGALLLLFLPRVFARWMALLTTIAGLALGLAAFIHTPVADLAHFTTIVRVPWVPALGMEYHLALDGVSLTMVLVTGISAVSTVLFSWDVEYRQNEFFFWLLLVVAGCYGVFLSANLFLLFVFYELVIVPKYFLIAIFGSTNKEYGAMKLTLYSFFGGMFVFIGILVAYVTAGSLDLNQLAQFQFPPQLQSWAFPVLFIGFAVLAGIWPLHTWAPTGHAAAPTAGSMLLAGIVMKLGSYAGLRVAMNLFPQGFQMWSKWIAVLAVIGIVYAAAVALRQSDLKFIIGYSSVSHMGFVLLGLAWSGYFECARCFRRGPANVFAWRDRGPALCRCRPHDLSPHTHTRSRRAGWNESEPRAAVCGVYVRYRFSRVDWHPRFQRVCRRDHNSHRCMENLSVGSLDHWGGHGARGGVHFARVKAIVLRRGRFKRRSHAGRPGGARPGSERATEHYSRGKNRCVPADVRNAGGRSLSKTVARSDHPRRRGDEVFKIRRLTL